MVSTKNTNLDHSWGLRQGADRYLSKPFSDEALVQTVEEVLREHALRWLLSRKQHKSQEFALILSKFLAFSMNILVLSPSIAYIGGSGTPNC